MRVTFLVDGFNLYNSLRDANAVIGKDVRWLDLNSLCSSYLPLIGKSATLEKIHYFSALTLYKKHYSPQTIERHKSYIECLEERNRCLHRCNPYGAGF